MRYRIKKETKPKLSTFGKYKAVAVHNQTIESRQLFEEAASRGMSISGGVLEGLMMTVADTVMRHLKMGDKVRLKNFGLLKLEIESDKVDNLKDFRAKKHILASASISFQKATKAPSPSTKASPSKKTKPTRKNKNAFRTKTDENETFQLS